MEKLHTYLKALGKDSGISMKKENFPDKAWLILAVASLSDGDDEIFNIDYVPQAADMRRSQPPQKLMIDNSDGLLDVPDSLIPKKHGRMIKMVTLTAADKIRAKIMYAEERARVQHATKERLKLQLAEAEEDAKYMLGPELTMKEMREQL